VDVEGDAARDGSHIKPAIEHAAEEVKIVGRTKEAEVRCTVHETRVEGFSLCLIF
jgi:hypothetical protein